MINWADIYLLIVTIGTYTFRKSLLKGLDLEVRAEPLCQLDWTLHINEDGIVEDVPELLDKIYR